MILRKTMTNQFICFVHIERAGGTTLHDMIQNTFPSYITLQPWSCWTNEDSCYFSRNEIRMLLRFLPFTRGVGGHTTRSFLKYEEVVNNPVFYFTFLRESISRYMSHLNFQRQVMKIPWKIENFINEPRFNNFQTVRLAGCEDVDEAKRTLEEDFHFVGITEHFDESLLLLKGILGENKMCINYEKKNSLEQRYEKKNSIRKRTATYIFDQLPSKIQDRIRGNNQLDIELYQFAKEKIYPRFKDAYQGNLAKELLIFQKSNKEYHYPKIRYFILKAYRKMVLHFVEPFAHYLSHR